MNSTYQTPAEAAASIRAAYKLRGWTSRQISVRAESYSMGSSIHILIRDPQIPLAPVKELAEKAEHIHRDDSGEILSGGNRFVDCAYSGEAIRARGAQYMPALTAAAVKLATADENSLISIEGTVYSLGKCKHWSGGFALWGETSFVRNCNELEGVAAAMAEVIQ